MSVFNLPCITFSAPLPPKNFVFSIYFILALADYCSFCCLMYKDKNTDVYFSCYKLSPSLVSSSKIKFFQHVCSCVCGCC